MVIYMKKSILIFFFLIISFICFAQEEKSQKYPQIDSDMKFYLPSIFGLTCGNNAKFGLRENYENVETCVNIMGEVRFSLITKNRFSFSTCIGFGSYFENSKNKENDLTSLNLSLGAGFYIHALKITDLYLSGICIYLYPAYQIPIYTWNYEPYLKWKMAFDLGYNLTLLETVTIYPYMRNIIGWNSKDFRYGLDFGIAVGIYFHDRNY